jgi:predicted lysophospholipase L1 biosynthesis ABC-type transport system permease subunit
VAFSAISPRIYIPLGYLDRTQLIQKGSLVRYRVFFKLDPKVQTSTPGCELTPQLQSLYLEADTVSRRTASIAATMENLSRYLQLAVFIAVLLAGVGVASISHVYAKDKGRSVALLRCLGAAPGATVAVYSIQMLGSPWFARLSALRWGRRATGATLRAQRFCAGDHDGGDCRLRASAWAWRLARGRRYCSP